MELQNLEENNEGPSTEIQSQSSPSNNVQIGKDGLPIHLPGQSPTHIEQDIEHIEENSEEEEQKSEYHSDQDFKKKGFFATVMNLLNSMLGAGILSVPNC